MDIICKKLANGMIYAYHKGRFWRWDDALRIWKESHLMAAKFERARAALKTLTPEVFFSNGAEFSLLDDYEIDIDMAEALRNAKPCKTAPIEPVKDDAPAACICTTCTCSGCKDECFGNCHGCGNPVQECNSYQTGGEKHLAPPLSSGAATQCGNTSVAPSFDFSVLGDLAEQAADADQQFDIHYGAAQDEYLISCIYLARIHALTAKAGRYGGGTWTKWYESKGLGEGSVRRMIQNGEAFNSAKLAELKQLPELTRKDLNLIARSGCAAQLVEAAGDSQRVQELLAQLKAEKERADTAESQRDAAYADVSGLQEQYSQMSQKANNAEEARIAARLQCQKAEAERDKAETRAKNAEDALKKQPIVGVTDPEEVDRLAAEKAWGLAAARNAEIQADNDKLTKNNAELAESNAALQKQVATLNSQLSDAAQTDFENANNIAFYCRRAWDAGKASYSRLVGEDLETTFSDLCATLNGIREEAARLCRQPPEYDGGGADE